MPFTSPFAVPARTPADMPSEPLKVACASCNLRELCLPVGLHARDLVRLDGLVDKRRSVPRGEHLFRNGERFEALYAVRTGFFKTCVGSEDGRDQVTGFQMAGELLGLDGISSDVITAMPSRWRTRPSASSPTTSWKACRASSPCCSTPSTRS
jgi:CRP/FNR family transcriptional regulator